MYYNTNTLFGPELKQAEEKTKKQEELVMDVFKKLLQPLTPSLVYRYLINNGKINANTPLTSIRRSITYLTQKEELVKTPVKVKGLFGSPEHKWRLK